MPYEHHIHTGPEAAACCLTALLGPWTHGCASLHHGLAIMYLEFLIFTWNRFYAKSVVQRTPGGTHHGMMLQGAVGYYLERQRSFGASHTTRPTTKTLGPRLVRATKKITKDIYWLVEVRRVCLCFLPSHVTPRAPHTPTLNLRTRINLTHARLVKTSRHRCIRWRRGYQIPPPGPHLSPVEKMCFFAVVAKRTRKRSTTLAARSRTD